MQNPDLGSIKMKSSARIHIKSHHHTTVSKFARLFRLLHAENCKQLTVFHQKKQNIKLQFCCCYILLLLYFVVVIFCCCYILLLLYFVVVIFCCCYILLLLYLVVGIFCCCYILLLLFFVVVIFFLANIVTKLDNTLC